MKGLSKGRYDETFAGEDGVLGTQKNHLNETVHLSTHNICFG